jgi:hypothetical protein
VDRFHEANQHWTGNATPTDLILRSRAQHGVSKDGRKLGTRNSILAAQVSVAILRDARKSALLWMRS